VRTASFGVQRTGQLGRITAAFDIGNLGCGKGYHLDVFTLAKQDVEVVKIPARRSHDDNVPDHST
jgi:hypothetical protein